MLPTQILHLDQELLSCLEANPQKFQQIYLEKAGQPKSPQGQQRQDIGTQFHLLMKQRLIGLPISFLLDAYPQYAQWIASLQSVAPYIFTPAPPDTLKECEYPCTLMSERHLFTCVYDLLIADNDKATIVEWTTSSMPSNPKLITANWQTRLYLYVLAEQGNYLPSEISMTYWFVHSQDLPQSLTIQYNATLHKRTRSQLKTLVRELNSWLASWQAGNNFPPASRSENPELTGHEQFKSTDTKTEKEDAMPSLDEIEEIAI